MRFEKLSFVPIALACLTFAFVAFAANEQPLAADATALQSDYVALKDRVDACPRGECADAAILREDFDALELRRAALDSKVEAIDLLAGSLSATFGGWEEES